MKQLSVMRNDRNEKKISNALLNYLRMTEESDSAYIQEKVIANFTRRVDLVVANGRLSAYEIKSAADSLDRLPGQLEDLSRSFEKVTVVCSVKHLGKVREILGRGRVGLMIINPDGIMRVVRQSRQARVPKKAWLEHLNVQQLARLLRAHRVPSFKAGMDRETMLHLSMKLQHKVIRSFVLSELKVHAARVKGLKKKRSRAARLRKALLANDPYYYC